MEDRDSAYNKSRDDLAVAQRDLRVAQNKIATLEKDNVELLFARQSIDTLRKENKQLSGSVEERDATIHILHKELVGEMANLDRPAYGSTGEAGHVCGQCGDVFTSGKSWSKFCSSKCRLRAFRARSRPEPAEAPAPTATPAKDPELAAIEQVLGILSKIEAEMGNAVSKRVLQYINNRHVY